jgi:hypothetical protein
MSSQDVTNGLKAHMGLMRIGPSCFGATLLTNELSPCVIPSVTLLELRLLGSRKAFESFRQNNSPA